MKNIFSTILLSFGSLLLPAQSRIYVNHAASGNNNGSSWQHAFSNLHQALALASAGDSIWVAQGVYVPTTDNNRDSAFFMHSGVRLFGGFVGTESALSQRDWAAHPTVLSGDIGVPGDSTDNSFNLLLMTEAEDGTLLDGLSFRLATAMPDFLDGSPFPRNACGAGLNISAADGTAYPLLRNCRFERCHAAVYGGAVFVHAAQDGSIAPQFINCVFEGNSSVLHGGAVYCNGFVDIERIPDFGGCTFMGNVSIQSVVHAIGYRGGAVHDTLHIQDCSFSYNGSAGGVVILTQTDNHLICRNLFFKENSAGGIITRYYHPLTGGLKSFEATNCTFYKNRGFAMNPFALESKTSNILIKKGIGGFFDSSTKIRASNWVIDSCGRDVAIAVTSWCNDGLISNFTISNYKFGGWSLIYQDLDEKTQFYNINVLNCDSMGFSHNTQYTDSLVLRHFNFIGNRFYLHPFAEYDIPLKFSNSLFYGNTYLNEALGKHPEVQFENCAFGTPGDCSQFPPQVICTNNLFGLNPMFRDSAAGDFSLLPCSPLINAGSNAAAAGILSDIAGNPRIREGRVDIGCYEAPPFAFATPPTVKPACAGAANGSISLSPQHGCEPYTYLWSPDLGNNPQPSTLNPGAYLLTLTDASGRQLFDTLSVGEASNPELKIAAQDVLCGGATGGSLSASVVGGTPPFAYYWSPTGLPDTAALTQLPAGSYALSVEDSNGCLDSASAQIALQGNLMLTIDGQHIRCYGDSAWLSATPSSGGAPFSWTWSGWSGTGPLASPLGPGQYAVTVTDAFGCMDEHSFPPQIGVDSLWLTAGSSTQTQNNPPNGAAVVTTTSGGTPGYSYAWSTGQSGQTITDIPAGLYTVTVTDSQGCTASTTVEVKLMVNTTNEIAKPKLLFWPNPAADWAELQLPPGLSGEAELLLQDAAGRQLRTQRVPLSAATLRIDLRGLSPGAYTVVLRSGAGIWVGKLVRG